MNKPPKSVAALVSAYFCTKYLQGRIENLLSQTLVPLVVITCEAGSKEEEIARSFNAPVEDMIIITTPGVPTVYDAWNLGIQASESKYLTSANSDDRHVTDGIETLFKVLERNANIPVAYPDVNRVREIGGEPFGRFEWLEGDIDLLIQGCFLGPMPMWRRSAHAKYGLFDPAYTSAGDYEFWMRLSSAKEKFKHVGTVLGDHLEREDALEHRSPVRAAWETARARSLYRK